MSGRNMVAVRRLVTCKRCGERDLAWLVSKKSRWYLAKAYRNGDGLVANPFAPHRCARAAS